MLDSDQSPGERALRLAREAGRRAGLDVSSANLLRVRSSVHVELPRAGVVARIEASGAGETAERQVRVARLLAERDAPVARLVRPELQPLLVEDGAVTLWRRLEAVGDPDLLALGQAIRALHDATRDSLPSNLPVIDPLREAKRLLDWPSVWSGTDESEAMRLRTGALEAEWQAAIRNDPLGRVIVHGDVHQDNAVVTKQGLVLVDLEDTGVGPASWDFVPLAVGVERYGVPRSDYAAFARGYGAEPEARKAHILMSRVYELLVTAWAMRCSGDSPRMAKEASARVATVLGRGRDQWTLL
jgi:aminoglycoside phosphotransferase (APT) family kinase protein